MDVIGEMKDIEHRISRLKKDLEVLSEEYKKASKNTKDFLGLCDEAGYTKVSVGMRHPSVPRSVGFPFGPEGSVFGFLPKKVKYDWPPIWDICERLDISRGAGNSHQHQIIKDALIPGVYHKKSGEWYKVV